MRKRTIFTCLLSILTLAILIGINTPAQASYGDVLRVISQTSNTINSVNRAGRGTMSTIEYGQRFQDRQQDRQDRKRAEKSYNASAEAEYYRTLQETRELQQRSNNNL